MSKVILVIKGGLGNQLFSYAAALRLSIVNNSKLLIDNVSGFTNDIKYKRSYQLHHFCITSKVASKSDRLEPFSRIRRYIIKRINSNLSYNNKIYHLQNGLDFDSRLLTLRNNKNLFLEGYWQSEDYFIDFSDVIRSEFKIIPPTDDLNNYYFRMIKSCKSVAIHVRFFNKSDSVKSKNVAVEYYYKSISYLESKFDNLHYFVFSDMPEFAQTILTLPKSRSTFISHNTSDDNNYADLYLMSQCDHFIIANSTFSWWGAWLSENVGKIVIAPNIYIADGEGAWGFNGLIPKKWVKF